jgi:hypothetical protein
MKTLLLTLFFSAGSILAAEQIPNPLIDYKEFQKSSRFSRASGNPIA